MLTCFVVFTEPGNQFLRIHRTIEGALANAIASGASAMIDGNAIVLDDVARSLCEDFQVTLICSANEDRIEQVRIERHGIYV